MVDFRISIPTQAVEHITDKSYYDHNYYQLKPYGDWWYGKCNVVYQVYDECCNCYAYTIGYFENDKFIGMLSWVISEDIFN